MGCFWKLSGLLCLVPSPLSTPMSALRAPYQGWQASLQVPERVTGPLWGILPDL